MKIKISRKSPRAFNIYFNNNKLTLKSYSL